MFYARWNRNVWLLVVVLVACAVRSEAARQLGPFEALEDVMFLMEREYYDSTFGGKPFLEDAEKLRVKMARTGMKPERAYPAIQRLLRSQKVSHLSFMPPPNYVVTPVLPKGQPTFRFADIARREDFRLHRIGEYWVVSWVRPASPAAMAGLRLGWIVERLDAHAPRFLGLGQGDSTAIAQRLKRWPKDTIDLRGINNTGLPAKLTVPLVPDESEVVKVGKITQQPDASSAMTQNCHVVRFDFFLPPTVNEVLALIKKTPESANGLILDLRDNRGGVGSLALPIASAVSTRRFSLGSQSSRGGDTQYLVAPGMKPYLGPVVVLVNESTHSTAEILARGLQAVGRAMLVGTQTSGRALPSLIRTLRDGSVLQMPVGDFRDVRGRPLEGNGVEPDRVVPLTLISLRSGIDPQLQAAVAYLKEANPTPTESEKP